MGLSGINIHAPLKITGFVFLFLFTCLGHISFLYAEFDNEPKSTEVKKIGIEEFQIQNRSKADTDQINPATGIKVADFFYNELLSYRHYELIAPAAMPFRIELVKTPKTGVELPSKVDSTKKPESGISEETNNDTMEIPGSDLIDLDSILAGVISRYSDTDLDAVVTGVITRYDDKVGSSIAVDRPASVAFMAYLISLKEKKIIWNGHFAETQTALFDNLLLADRFTEAGGKWLNSDTLTELVMQKVIKTFPGVRKKTRGSPILK